MDDDDEPPKKRGRPKKPKLTVIEGDALPRAPELPDADNRLRFDHRIASYCKYKMFGYSHQNALLASGYDDSKPDLVRRHMSLIKQGITTTLNVSVDSLLIEVEEVRLAALIGQQYSVALAAIAMKAKLRGLIDTPPGAGDPGTLPKPVSEPVDVTEMSMEDWKARFAPNRQT